MATFPKANVLSDETLAKVVDVKKNLGQAQHKCKECLHSGQWLRLSTVHYLSADGQERTWEVAERTTQSSNAVDGVDLIAMLPREKKISLVAIYRPAINKISLEFPAGLLNVGEATEKGALRELQEETGYHGCLKRLGSEVFVDPWKSTENTIICTAEVNTEDPKNQTRQLSLDDDELLMPIELALEDLLLQLELLQTEHDFAIESKLYTFALGLQLAKSLNSP